MNCELSWRAAAALCRWALRRCAKVAEMCTLDREKNFLVTYTCRLLYLTMVIYQLGFPGRTLFGVAEANIRASPLRASVLYMWAGATCNTRSYPLIWRGSVPVQQQSHSAMMMLRPHAYSTIWAHRFLGATFQSHSPGQNPSLGSSLLFRVLIPTPMQKASMVPAPRRCSGSFQSERAS